MKVGLSYDGEVYSWLSEKAGRFAVTQFVCSSCEKIFFDKPAGTTKPLETSQLFGAALVPELLVVAANFVNVE